jgi:hypothetical protein
MCLFVCRRRFLTLFCLSCGSDVTLFSAVWWAVWRVWFAAEQCWEIHNTIPWKRWRDGRRKLGILCHHNTRATFSRSFWSCGTNTEPRLIRSPGCHLQLSASLSERYYYWLSIQSNRYECAKHVTTHDQGTDRGHFDRADCRRRAQTCDLIDAKRTGWGLKH